MTPADLMTHVEARLETTFCTQRVNPWRAGAAMAAKRLGITERDAIEGALALKCGFTRVMQERDDPRVFRLATAEERARAVPVLLLRVADVDDGMAEAIGDDVIAFSLTPDSRRFWRWTLDVSFLGDTRLPKSGVVGLRQDAHAWLAATLRAAAAKRRCEEERRDVVAKGIAAARVASRLDGMVEAVALPADDARRRAYLEGLKAAIRAGEAVVGRWAQAVREPPGVLVLDPTGVRWTRLGALHGAESIEILDAPAMGPLGRALKRLNPTIGTPRGVALYGVEGKAQARRRAA